MEEHKDIIKYCFTKYLETAVKRCRKDYMQKKFRIQSIESLMDLDEIPISDIEMLAWNDSERDLEIFMNKFELRSFLNEHIGSVVLDALKKLRDIEVEILCMKALNQYSHREIGERLHMDEKQVASIYNYAKKKLRKELGENGL